jgi:nucleoside-diphosphate kinase
MQPTPELGFNMHIGCANYSGHCLRLRDRSEAWYHLELLSTVNHSAHRIICTNVIYWKELVLPGAIERTLVVFKPDAVMRGLVGRLTQRFEDAGLKIVGVKMKQLDADFTRKHYFDLEDRLGKAVYDITANFVQQGPVIALVLEGVEAVGVVRKLIGGTYPSEAVPGTIRGDFAHQSKSYTQVNQSPIANLVHASGNVEEAKYEVDLWFDADEQFSYQTLAERFTF